MAERTRHAAWTLAGNGVGTVTITDAGPLNLLGTPVIDEVTAAVTDLAGRADLRALVLRGTGDRAFIGGADIREMVRLDEPGARRFISRLAGLCEAVRRCPVPVIVRLAGWCLGGGLEVAAAADIRICAEDARFGMPEVAVGIPSVIHAALLPRLVGAGRAGWLVLTGKPVDAATALSWGLVDEVCAPDALDAAVDATARRFAELGPNVVRQQKKLLRAWERLPVDEAIEASVPEFGAAFTAGEPQRFMTAFLRRREPGHDE